MSGPRFVPVVDTSMAPTMNPGDLLAVTPAEVYQGAGMYVLELLGEPRIVRAGVDGHGRLTVSFDNPQYHGARPMIQDAFEEALLGRVLAVCRIVDVVAMAEVGLLGRRGSTQHREG